MFGLPRTHLRPRNVRLDTLVRLRWFAVFGQFAAVLVVHRNTLLYRIARIEKLTKLSLKEQRDRTLVLLAVTWQDIASHVQPSPGQPPDPRD